MRLRPYCVSDFDYIRRWITDRRAHELWCAGCLSFPLNEEEFHSQMRDKALECGECGFVLSEDDGTPLGFCSFSIDDSDNSGFVRRIVVDAERRGQGLGGQMLSRMLRYAGNIAGVFCVRLTVFDANPAARRCYEKLGFEEKTVLEDSHSFEGECWKRTLLECPVKE